MRKDLIIKQRILGEMSNSLSSLNFIDFLMKHSRVLVFGGAVREAYSSLSNNSPRDFDLVLVNYKGDLYNDLVYSGHDVTRNKFGGIKLKIDENSFDVWKIEDTWAFKNDYVQYRRIEDLYKTVYLNIDGIFYDLNNELIYSDGYDEAIKTKKLDIVLQENPQLMLNIMRAFKLKEEYNLSFSESLKNVIDFQEFQMGKHNFYCKIDKLFRKRYKRNTVLT
ncbi:hypothetical protein [Exiguobacterium chiriqhucha]|uniref:hypothetical protein n=1 Tax=Exiguobacterium chiriqhucha TaxID=1385984 RepID=UPI0038BBA7B3